MSRVTARAARVPLTNRCSVHTSVELPADYKIDIQPPPTNLNVQKDRMMLYKSDGSGYFLQLALSPEVWIEFRKDYPEAALAWTVCGVASSRRRRGPWCRQPHHSWTMTAATGAPAWRA